MRVVIHALFFWLAVSLAGHLPHPGVRLLVSRLAYQEGLLFSLVAAAIANRARGFLVVIVAGAAVLGYPFTREEAEAFGLAIVLGLALGEGVARLAQERRERVRESLPGSAARQHVPEAPDRPAR